MPIFTIQDASLFPHLNWVLFGYLLLTFAPRWKLTSVVTLFLPMVYSALYFALAVNFFANNPDIKVNFSSLDGIISLFRVPEVVMAGWVHYIAFDLLVARYIVYDALEENISHFWIIPLIPITLFAGPIGFSLYMTLKAGKYLFVKLRLHLVMYFCVSSLCIFMAIWIFIMPASFRLAVGTDESKRAHLRTLELAFARGNLPVIADIQTKYFGHLSVVLTHQLPAGIWAVLVPFQLNSVFRRKYSKIHKLFGYIFLGCAALITVGVFLIIIKQLTFEHSFPELMNVTSGFSELGLSPLQNSLTILNYFLGSLAVYFLMTALVAARYAIRKKYTLHRAWIVRHIASGISVALQRVYVLLRKAREPGAQRAAFYDGIIVSVVFCLLVAELYVRFYSTGCDDLNEAHGTPHQSKDPVTGDKPTYPQQTTYSRDGLSVKLKHT